jgi:hypothetical protein
MAELAREAGRRRMSAAERLPGLEVGDGAGEGDLPSMVLPAKRREGQRMFWRLRCAWRCAMIVGHGRIISILPVEQKARLRAWVSCSRR